MKLLAGFLKREHNVHPRVFDEAMYVVSVTLLSVHSTCGLVSDYGALAKMYYLPLLPGYSPSTTVRSSTAFTKTHLNRLSEAEENGYQGSYFATPRPRSREGSTRREDDGFVTEGSPIETRRERDPPSRLMFSAESEADAGGETEADGGFVTDLAGETEVEHDYPLERDHPPSPTLQPASPQRDPEPELEQPVAEVIFFAYGVTVFYGFSEVQERSIIDDLAKAGIFRRMIKESDWEIEECHFAVRSRFKHIPFGSGNNVISRLTRPFPIQGYTMISLVCRFASSQSKCPHRSLSIQVPISPSQALHCTCPRTIHPACNVRDHCFPRPLRPARSLHPAPTRRVRRTVLETQGCPPLDGPSIQAPPRRESRIECARRARALLDRSQPWWTVRKRERIHGGRGSCQSVERETSGHERFRA